MNTTTNKRIGYGELQRVRNSDDNFRNCALIGAKDWKLAGKTVPRVNGRNFISGKHVYVSDMKLPGMLYGKVLRAPSYGAKLLEADLQKQAIYRV